jgi:dipeptidyl aminopeptidase/acylaminoacyl peptidase
MNLARSIISPRTSPRTMPRTGTRPEPHSLPRLVTRLMPRLVIAGAIGASLFSSLGSTRLWWLLTSAHAAASDDATEFPDLEAFAKALVKATPGVRFETFGLAAGAPPRPLIVLADPPATPSTAKAPKPGGANDRLVVLAVADLSGDDGESREGLLRLARELAQANSRPLLRDVVVLLAPLPRTNPVAGQTPAASPAPAAATSNPIDWRREFAALADPDSRALVQLAREWKPDLVLEFRRPAATQPSTLPLPRFGAEYFASGPAHGIVATIAGDGSLRQRGDIARAMAKTVVEFAASNKPALRAAPQVAVAPTPLWKRTRPMLRIEPAATAGSYVVRGLPMTPAAGTPSPMTPSTGTPVPNAETNATSVPAPQDMPFAYLLPASAVAAAETLQRHGFVVETLREDIELELAIPRRASPNRATAPKDVAPTNSAPTNSAPTNSAPTAANDASSRPLALAVTWRGERRRVDAGTILVRGATPLAPLLAQLLEPESDVGFAAWRLLDAPVGEDWPVCRLLEHAPLLTATKRPPPERRAAPQRVTFDLWQRGAVNLHGDIFPACQWLDEEHYLQRREGRLWRIHAATGRWSAFPANVEPLLKSIASLPGIGGNRAEGIVRNVDSRLNADRTAFLFEFSNDLYYARLDGSRSVRLTTTPQREELATFSPDGHFVAFVRDLNVFVIDVATGSERQLTTDGGGRVRCGKADWVYYEELFMRDWRAYWWSPDSQRIAFLRIDDGPVLDFTVIDPVPPRQPTELTPYPKAGDALPLVQLGCVSIAGGPPVWAKLEDYPPPETLISRAGFTADGKQVFAHVLNRQQTRLDYVVADPATGATRRLFRETTKAWVDDHGAPLFLADGGLLFLSERDGYRHLYRYAADGQLVGPVTSGPWEVRGQPWLTKDQRWLHFSGTRDGWLGSQDYRLPLPDPMAMAATMTGTATAVANADAIERLTAEGGTHATQWNGAGTLCIDRRGDLTTPARAALIGPNGQRLRTLDNNPAAGRESFVLGRVERLEIPAAGGFTLDALLFYPSDFDERRRYPVWIKTYGGPHMPSVRDAWEGGRVEDHAHANAGFLVLRIDPRSASGKGAAATWTAYKQLGKQELADLEEAIRWLGKRPYVASDRVGLSGYSYGGFLTCYALTHSKLFAAGVAGAPVTDWRNYDAIYTERYMDTPQNNPAGYAASSVVAAARELNGKLLLAHGVMDDNVHVQNSLQLLGALQDANKFVETQFYPRARHGVPQGHFSRLTFDFMVRHLR